MSARDSCLVHGLGDRAAEGTAPCTCDPFAGLEHDQTPTSVNRLQRVVFHWSTEYGKCEDCGLPAAFRQVDAYGAGVHMIQCAVCAANAACEGATIERI